MTKDILSAEQEKMEKEFPDLFQLPENGQSVWLEKSYMDSVLAFLLASNARIRLQTLQECQGMIEGKKVDDKEHTHACHYRRKGCDCGKLERMIHNKVLQEVINLIK